MNHHEFRLEPYGQLDREAAYDDEVLFARRRVRRQLLGVGFAVALNVGIGYVAFQALGWVGVILFGVIVTLVLFMRGTHAYPSAER